MSNKTQDDISERLRISQMSDEFIRLEQRFDDEQKFNDERRNRDASLFKERLTWITIIISLVAVIIMIVAIWVL